jgi:MYXO-CTERM domain-containing protein
MRPSLLPLLTILLLSPAALAQEGEGEVECAEHSTRLDDGECQCNQGYEWSEEDLRCLLIPCPPRETRPDGWEGEVPPPCDCKEHFTRDVETTECDADPCGAAFQVRDDDGGCGCAPNHPANEETGVCEPTDCPAEEVGANRHRALTGECACDRFYVAEALPDDAEEDAIADCACPEDGAPDDAQGCVCLAGYEWSDLHSDCIPLLEECPENSSHDPQPDNPGKCLCDDGYRFNHSDWVCERDVSTCGSHSFPAGDGTGCVCEEDFFPNPNPKKKGCVPHLIDRCQLQGHCEPRAEGDERQPPEISECRQDDGIVGICLCNPGFELSDLEDPESDCKRDHVGPIDDDPLDDLPKEDPIPGEGTKSLCGSMAGSGDGPGPGTLMLALGLLSLALIRRRSDNLVFDTPRGRL